MNSNLDITLYTNLSLSTSLNIEKNLKDVFSKNPYYSNQKKRQKKSIPNEYIKSDHQCVDHQKPLNIICLNKNCSKKKRLICIKCKEKYHREHCDSIIHLETFLDKIFQIKSEIKRKVELPAAKNTDIYEKFQEVLVTFSEDFLSLIDKSIAIFSSNYSNIQKSIEDEYFQIESILKELYKNENNIDSVQILLIALINLLEPKYEDVSKSIEIKLKEVNNNINFYCEQINKMNSLLNEFIVTKNDLLEHTKKKLQNVFFKETNVKTEKSTHQKNNKSVQISSFKFDDSNMASCKNRKIDIQNFYFVNSKNIEDSFESYNKTVTKALNDSKQSTFNSKKNEDSIINYNKTVTKTVNDSRHSTVNSKKNDDSIVNYDKTVTKTVNDSRHSIVNSKKNDSVDNKDKTVAKTLIDSDFSRSFRSNCHINNPIAVYNLFKI